MTRDTGCCQPRETTLDHATSNPLLQNAWRSRTFSGVRILRAREIPSQDHHSDPLPNAGTEPEHRAGTVSVEFHERQSEE